jgi:predicted AlkP superfamily phosphohydrolase/phosphomutase
MRHRLIIALAAVAVLLGACGQPAPPTGVDGPIVVLGIDGAEWSIMEPLLAAGDLPNLGGLIERGAAGRLASLDPRRKSPVIWTTIATGLAPEDHGVGGFVIEGNPHGQDTYSHYSSNMWKAPAFWDILGERGKSVGIIGWLVTWPPWPVNGYMISQHVQYLERFRRSETERGVSWPDGLDDAIAPYVTDENALTAEQLGRFTRSGVAGLEVLTQHYEEGLRRALAGDESTYAVARFMLSDEVPDVACVYTRGVDEVCHRFWIHAHDDTRPPVDPAKPGTATLAGQAAELSGLIDEYYRYTDERVGEILALLPDNATVVVCSDHGFRGPGVWGEHQPWYGEDQHGLNGVLIVSGPGVRRGFTIQGASVYDVAPTILALAAAPVADDMSGRPLTEIFTEEFARANPVATIESYGRTQRTGEAPIESPVDAEVLERLRSLGYIQ